MSIKFFILLLLGLLVAGLLIILMYKSSISMMTIYPAEDEVAINNLLSRCQSKMRIYNNSPSENYRHDLCCTYSDLNNNAFLESDEYCHTACSSCGAYCGDYINGDLGC